MNLRDLLFLHAASGSGGSATEYTATGNPVSFDTNIVKPLNSVVIPLTYTQEGSGDPSPSNVRPITGISSLYCVHAKKNMATLRGYSAANRGYDLSGVVSNSYGTTISATDPVRSLVITQSESSTDYTKSNYRNGYFSIRTDNMVDGRYYDVSLKVTDIGSNPLSSTINDWMIMPGQGSGSVPNEVKGNVAIWKNILYREAATYRQAWEVRNCGMSCTVSEFMVTPANTNDGVYEPYDGAKLDVTFPVDVGTVYGGSLDLVSGVLTIEWECQSARWGDIRTDRHQTTGYYQGTFDFEQNMVSAISPSDYGSKILCNIVSLVRWEGTSFTPEHIYIPSSNKKIAKVVGDYDPDTIVQIAAKYETPITIQLDPHSITAIKGINTIWTNTPGDLTVKYLKKG